MFLDVAIQFRHIQYIIILSYIHSVIIFDAYICLQGLALVSIYESDVTSFFFR